MASKIQVALGVEGASAFRKAMQDSNAAVKALGTELKLTAAQFGNAATSEQGLKAQNDVLERTVLTLNEKLAEQEKALAQVASEFGEASTETINFQNEVNKTKLAIANANNQMEANNALLGDMAGASAEAEGATGLLGSAALAGGAALAGLGAAAAAAVGELKSMVLDAAGFADDILTLSTVTGIGTESLQEFKYMEDLVDVSTDTLVTAERNLLKTMNSAANGNTAAAEAFQLLGVSIYDSTGHLKKVDDVFWEMIPRIATIGNETERDALEMQLFGKSAQELNPLTEQLDKVAAARQAAHDSGSIFTKEELEGVAAISDALAMQGNELARVAMGMAEAFGPEIIAGIEAVTSVLTFLMESIGGLVILIGKAATGLRALFGGGKDIPTVSPSAASTPAAMSSYNGAIAPSIQPINMNVTTQLDGTTLARSMYSYNANEQQRHGANFVAGK